MIPDSKDALIQNNSPGIHNRFFSQYVNIHGNLQVTEPPLHMFFCLCIVLFDVRLEFGHAFCYRA